MSQGNLPIARFGVVLEARATQMLRPLAGRSCHGMAPPPVCIHSFGVPLHLLNTLVLWHWLRVGGLMRHTDALWTVTPYPSTP